MAINHFKSFKVSGINQRHCALFQTRLINPKATTTPQNRNLFASSAFHIAPFWCAFIAHSGLLFSLICIVCITLIKYIDIFSYGNVINATLNGITCVREVV